MKKAALAVLALSLVCMNLFFSCKKKAEEAAPVTTEEVQPADTEDAETPAEE